MDSLDTTFLSLICHMPLARHVPAQPKNGSGGQPIGAQDNRSRTRLLPQRPVSAKSSKCMAFAFPCNERISFPRRRLKCGGWTNSSGARGRCGCGESLLRDAAIPRRICAQDGIGDERHTRAGGTRNGEDIIHRRMRASIFVSLFHSDFYYAISYGRKSDFESETISYATDPYQRTVCQSAERQIRHWRLQRQQHGAASGHCGSLRRRESACDASDFQGRTAIRESGLFKKTH